MRFVRSATVGMALVAFTSSANAQYYFFYAGRSAEPSYTSSLVGGGRKTEGAIKRGYINKYGHVVVTEREKSPDAGSASESETQSVRPAARAMSR